MPISLSAATPQAQSSKPRRDTSAQTWIQEESAQVVVKIVNCESEHYGLCNTSIQRIRVLRKTEFGLAVIPSWFGVKGCEENSN